MFAAGAIAGLLLIVGGQQAEDEGLGVHHAQVGQGVCHRGIDIFVVAGLALDYATQADDGIGLFVVGKDAGASRQLERTRHLDSFDICFGGTVLDQGIIATLIKRMGDFSIPVRNHDAKFHACGRRDILFIVLGKVFQCACHIKSIFE